MEVQISFCNKWSFLSLVSRLWSLLYLIPILAIWLEKWSNFLVKPTLLKIKISLKHQVGDWVTQETNAHEKFWKREELPAVLVSTVAKADNWEIKSYQLVSTRIRMMVCDLLPKAVHSCQLIWGNKDAHKFKGSQLSTKSKQKQQWQRHKKLISEHKCKFWQRELN